MHIFGFDPLIKNDLDLWISHFLWRHIMYLDMGLNDVVYVDKVDEETFCKYSNILRSAFVIIFSQKNCKVKL